MRLMISRSAFTVLAIGLLIGFTTATAAANSVSGEAYGVSVDAAVVTVPKTPRVVLPPDGGMVEDEALKVDVPGTIVSKTLGVMTTGSIGAGVASAQSSATVEEVNILDGLVTARLVVAMSSSTSDGTTATSTGEGSTLIGLVVNGVALGDVTPPPNTVIDIPGVGTLILNEQITGGDGVQTTELTVNMIHVVLNDPLAGEIVVASAHSDVNFRPTPVPTTGFMTGGGRLGTGRAIATFGFNAGLKNGAPTGQLQYTDHDQRVNVHSTEITGYSSRGDTCVTFSGTARVNGTDGFTFTVTHACDNGEPGVGRDTFEISVEEISYFSSERLGDLLTGGNLQLH